MRGEKDQRGSKSQLKSREREILLKIIMLMKMNAQLMKMKIH